MSNAGHIKNRRTGSDIFRSRPSASSIPVLSVIRQLNAVIKSALLKLSNCLHYNGLILFISDPVPFIR